MHQRSLQSFIRDRKKLRGADPFQLLTFIRKNLPLNGCTDAVISLNRSTSIDELQYAHPSVLADPRIFALFHDESPGLCSHFQCQRILL